MFNIEKSIRLPERKIKMRGTRKRKFPVMDMAVGDSFFAPGYVPSAQQRMFDTEKTITSSGWRRAVPGSKWMIRTVVEAGVRGVRVWRVA